MIPNENKRRCHLIKLLKTKKPGDIFYKSRMKVENWPDFDLCDPPTDPRTAIHALIDHFLGKDWYVTMPESDDQVITAAVAEIMNKYPKPRKYKW